MTKKGDSRSPASILQRLRNACVEGQSVKNAQTLFVLERFLARVARSRYQDRLVLKGGVLLFLLLRQWLRPTEGLDFLALRIPGEATENVLKEILAVEAGDGLEFDSSQMTWDDIREESGYPCRRFTIPYRFGARHIHFIKLDLSFGDPVTPGPRPVELTPILEGFVGGTVLGYPVETLLAEKIETFVARGLASTRSKDIFDLWTLCRTRADLRMEDTAKALAATATYRGTLLDPQCIALQPGFAEDPRQQKLWLSYVRPRNLVAPPFADVIGQVQSFVGLILEGAAGRPGAMAWVPATMRWQ